MTTYRLLFIAIAALSAGIRTTDAGGEIADPPGASPAALAERALKTATAAVRSTEFDLQTVREAQRAKPEDAVHVRPLAQSALWRAKIVLDQVDTALQAVRRRLEEGASPEIAARMPDSERPGRTMAARVLSDEKALRDARLALVNAIAQAIQDFARNAASHEGWVEEIESKRRQMRMAEHSLYSSRAMVERQGDVRRDLGRYEVQLEEMASRLRGFVHGPPPFSPPREPGLAARIALIDAKLKGRADRQLASPAPASPLKPWQSAY